MSRDTILAEVAAKRAAQEKWYSQDHDWGHSLLAWVTNLTAILGKLSYEALQQQAQKALNMHGLAKMAMRNFREQLISLAALCVAAAEAVDIHLSEDK